MIMIPPVFRHRQTPHGHIGFSNIPHVPKRYGTLLYRFSFSGVHAALHRTESAEQPVSKLRFRPYFTPFSGLCQCTFSPNFPRIFLCITHNTFYRFVYFNQLFSRNIWLFFCIHYYNNPCKFPLRFGNKSVKGVYNLYFMSKSVDKPKYSGYNK